jgi:hypothetical protein
VAAHRHGCDWQVATTADGLKSFRGIPFPVNIRMPTISDQAVFRFAGWSMIPKVGTVFGKDHAQIRSRIMIPTRLDRIMVW